MMKKAGAEWAEGEYTEISKKASELVGLYAAPSEYKEE